MSLTQNSTTIITIVVMPKLAQDLTTELHRAHSSLHRARTFHGGAERSAPPRPEYGAELSGLAEWQLAQRVASSRAFSRSEFLPRFLLYVCERQLTGRVDEITEIQVGIHVFQRPVGYSPAEDNIVRNYARSLRRRLQEYFHGEGSAETMRIVIPRGGYVPSFEKNKTDEDLPGEEVAESSTSAPPMAVVTERNRRAGGPWAAVAGLVVGLCLASAGWLLARPIGAPMSQSPASLSYSHAIWMQLFQHKRDALIVPADSGLGILQNLTHETVSLPKYASGEYLGTPNDSHGLDPGSLNDLRTQQYTSVTDLNTIFALAHLPEFDANRVRIRSPRDVSTNDLKHSNVVLLGSVHSNPWVELFDKKLNFHLAYSSQVDQSVVVNDNPERDEQKFYRNEAGMPLHRTYAAIDYLPSLDGGGHVLIIQGLTMAGTQAAADLLLHSRTIEPVLKKAALADGTLQPFEVLIETSTVGADAPDAHIVATRIHPL